MTLSTGHVDYGRLPLGDMINHEGLRGADKYARGRRDKLYVLRLVSIVQAVYLSTHLYPVGISES